MEADKLKAILFLLLILLVIITITFLPNTKTVIIDTFLSMRDKGTYGIFQFVILYALSVVITIPVTMINISMGLIYPFFTA
mmetsp:Transcript_21379/g.3472  ORF Transcript_21379/g.3472 Transcript_21379/m.3472 type:complete len:81 (-) Transcript_21379:452-694(-)